jgi:hypothetical protein
MPKFDPEILKHFTIEELLEANSILDEDAQLWHPLEGPQTDATDSHADITGFGGAGGGGKSDWILGLALTRHRHSIVFRENGTELAGLNIRLREILPPDNYNGREQRWSFTRPDGVPCAIELGSFPDIGDEQKYRGRPHDLLAFDEATNMREQQVRFLFAWARTVQPEQRVRIVLTFNPPSTVEGRWIISFFAPWLDDLHPNPALPGELRWFATIAGIDIEVPDNRAFVLSSDNVTRVYDFDPAQHRLEDVIKPQSRTFIPSRVTDNPFLAGTGYMRTLQALPEPLRSQMLKGDFKAGMREDAFQVIPTAWVDAAMARWKPRPKKPVMDSMGVDVAMGGADEHVIMRRHANWFDEPIAHKGSEIPDGAQSGSQVVAALRDNAVIHVDLLGPGAMTYGFLMQLQLQAIGVNFGELVSAATDQHGRLRFTNLRSYLWWKMREALDPLNNNAIELPPHKRLRADLCAPKYSLPGQAIKVQSRDDIIKAIGRSPDYGTAAILALIDTPKVSLLRQIVGGHERIDRGYDPYAILNSPTP